MVKDNLNRAKSRVEFVVEVSGAIVFGFLVEFGCAIISGWHRLLVA